MGINETNFITSVAVIYGAIIATISLIISTILAWHEIKKQMPRVKVIVDYGKMHHATSGVSEPLITISAINLGSQNTTITGVGLLFKDGYKHYFIDPPLLKLPYEIQPNKKCYTVISCRVYRDEIQKSRITAAFFQDEVGNLWKGKITKKLKFAWINAPEI